MSARESHLSDQDVLLLMDGELSAGDRARAESHLNACWVCRTRKQELEEAIGNFVRIHRNSLDSLLPPPTGPRALLKARIAQATSEAGPFRRPGPIRFTPVQIAGALAFLAVVAMIILSSQGGWVGWRPNARRMTRDVPVSFPEPSLTPGAVTAATREQICSSVEPKNRSVSATLRRRGFEESGLIWSEPQAYEVDYLITPALGGADDIRNLWPQSYNSAIWNAYVKDALEDRLRDMVCGGKLDLISAQEEISSDWIAAYKKYFHTDKPLYSTP